MKEKINIKELNLPNHLAIILDGNGRWAKKFGMPRTFGHQQGVKNLIKISKYCNEIGIKELTVYAFSTENWSRPKEEVDYLMQLLKENFDRLSKKVDSNIVIKVVGEKTKLSDELLEIIEKVENATKDNSGLKLNIAFNYGSRDELVHAMKEIVSNNEEITKENISKHLYVSDVDLLIRTSGECRISNFLLWQISYSEFYFTKVHWPAFSPKELDKALIDFSSRNRRYGGLKEEKK